jgi:hypothetical protein
MNNLQALTIPRQQVCLQSAQANDPPRPKTVNPFGTYGMRKEMISLSTCLEVPTRLSWKRSETTMARRPLVDLVAKSAKLREEVHEAVELDQKPVV